MMDVVTRDHIRQPHKKLVDYGGKKPDTRKHTPEAKSLNHVVYTRYNNIGMKLGRDPKGLAELVDGDHLDSAKLILLGSMFLPNS